MGDNTAIEWTDASWTPIRAHNKATGKVGWHCTHASEGCRNCYAEGLNRRLGTGLPFKPGHEKDLELFLDEAMLLQPLRWKRPRMIFVCSMTDLFADFVRGEWIDRIFAVMALAPQHTFQVLTKRSRRMREYLTRLDEEPPLETARRVALAWPARVEVPADGITFPLPNVWLGVSAEDQTRADERIPDLLATPAAVRFVSAEPLLGPIDLTEIDDGLRDGVRLTIDALTGLVCDGHEVITGVFGSPDPRLDWIIAGGESGPHARPMHPDWARSLRDQCEAAGVPFFFKQWGEWLPGQNDPYPHFPDGRKVAHWQDGGWGPRDVSRWSASRNYVMWEPNGTLHLGGTRYDSFFEVAAWAQRVGKRAAGRLLDGREHNDMPGAAR